MNLQIIDGIGILLGITEAVLLYFLFKSEQLTTFVKWLVLFGVIIIPIITLATANYHVFETSKKVDACAKCHVMKPFANDMRFADSTTTLAARHYRNRWITKNACYSCHKDYGFQGTIDAKLDGYRHLMRYITATYQEPITFRGEFNFNNCMSCHAGTEQFETLDAHQPVIINYQTGDGTIACTNCHGTAHPKKSRRTPGHPDFEKLKNMDDSQVYHSGQIFNLRTSQDIQAVKNYIKKF